MELGFEAENVAEFFYADMRIFFDEINDMIHFVMQKCFARRHIEMQLAGAVEGTFAHSGEFAQLFQSRLFGEIVVKNGYEFCRFLMHHVTGSELFIEIYGGIQRKHFAVLPLLLQLYTECVPVF